VELTHEAAVQVQGLKSGEPNGLFQTFQSFVVVALVDGLFGWRRIVSEAAVVIIGGLIAATLLTLIVLPTLYLVIEDGLPERSGKRLNQSLKQRRRPLRLKSASVQHRN